MRILENVSHFEEDKIKRVHKIIEKVIYKYEKVDNNIYTNIDILLDILKELNDFDLVKLIGKNKDKDSEIAQLESSAANKEIEIARLNEYLVIQEKTKVKPDELKELESEIEKISGSAQISEGISNSLNALGEENESVSHAIKTAIKHLVNLTKYDVNLEKIANGLEAGLDDIAIAQSELTAYLNGLDSDPAYFDSVYVAGRLLGDDHIGQHSHDGTFSNVSNPSSWVESCQQNGFDNCFNIFGGCPDQCGTITGYEVEYNNSGRQDLFKATPQGGISFYFSQQASAAVDFAQSNSFGNSGFRNYILASEDPQSSNTGNYPYNVTLDQNAVQWINNGNYHQPHDHQSSSYSITKGTMTIPTTYSINNLGTGNIAPVNAPQQAIGTIQIETDTPV